MPTTCAHCVRLAFALLLPTAGAAHAQVEAPIFHGYADLRIAAADVGTDWMDGGTGKLRFGNGDEGLAGGAVLAGAMQLAPAWLATAEVQFLPQQRRAVDLLDASVRYRPVSTTPWRWSVRTGVFFPPISLESDNIGWTSTWTLTPSAINSWVGEELRTVGSELRVEYRGDAGTVEGFGALYGRNDPAGELLASRGWSMGDLTSGLFATLREPDAYVRLTDSQGPALYQPFVEIDDRIGWYAGASWERGAYKVTALHYDNRADPTAERSYQGRDVYAWHTYFSSAGVDARVGDVVLLAQAMHGSTAFEPAPGLLLDTKFNAGYVLLGWDAGDWQPALRVDLFQSRQLPEAIGSALREHGNALTVALNWRPQAAWRVTGEYLRVDSSREQRREDGDPARRIERQLQLSLRYLF